MKINNYMFILIFSSIVMVFPTALLAKNDVIVKGYYRSDGTYVRPHIRTSPDNYKFNNYGPSRNSHELMYPKLRDKDRDGMPNYLDHDDDNDGIPDNYDSSQY